MNENKLIFWAILFFLTIVVICNNIHYKDILKLKDEKNKSHISHQILIKKNKYMEPLFHFQIKENLILRGNLPKSTHSQNLLLKIEKLFIFKKIDNRILFDKKVSFKGWLRDIYEVILILKESKVENISVLFKGESLDIDGFISKEEEKKIISKKLTKITELFIRNSLKVKKYVVKSIKIQKVIDELLANKKIDFTKNSDILTKDANETLNIIIENLKKIPNEKVRIEGYANSYQDGEKNRILSQKRADKIKRFLIEKGLNGDRIMAIGYGNNRLDDNKSISKVEIYVM